MDRNSRLIESVLQEKYAGTWDVEIPGKLWKVSDGDAAVVIANPNGTMISLGAFIGGSTDLAGLSVFAARSCRDFRTGRLFVAEAQPGTHCLIVEDYLSPWTLEADNADVLIWQSLELLLGYAKSTRDTAVELEEFQAMDMSLDTAAMVTLQFLLET